MNKKGLVKIFECKKVIRNTNKFHRVRIIPFDAKFIHHEKRRIKFKSSGPFKNGRWNLAEHESFVKSCILFGNNWKKIQEIVKTRSRAQIRSHAQKYLNKLCKKYGIHMIPKNFSKKGRVLVDEYGEWFDMKTCNVDVDDTERKILEIFNYNYSCFKVKTKKILRENYQNTIQNKSLLLQTNKINLIKKQPKKTKKVFKIFKKQREEEFSHKSYFQKTIEDLVGFNTLIIKEISQFSLSTEPIFNSLLNKSEKTQPYLIDNDFNLKELFDKDVSKSIEFFNSLKSMQIDIQNSLKKFYDINLHDIFGQETFNDEILKSKNLTKNSELSTKYDDVIQI